MIPVNSAVATVCMQENRPYSRVEEAFHIAVKHSWILIMPAKLKGLAEERQGAGGMDKCSWGRWKESGIWHCRERGGREPETRQWFRQGETISAENMPVQLNREKFKCTSDMFPLQLLRHNIQLMLPNVLWHGSVPSCFEAIVPGLRTGSLSPAVPHTFAWSFCVIASPLPRVHYLTHASNPRHYGVVKEVKFFSRLTKEEVNLVVVAHRVAYRLTLLDVSWPNKDGIC